MIISSSLSTLNFTGLDNFFAAMLVMAANKKDCVSFPPKPPPILLTITWILL